MTTTHIMLAVTLALAGCAESEQDYDQADQADDGTESGDGECSEEFRDGCAPGFCCENCIPASPSGSLMCESCAFKPAAECQGSYFSCDSKCYTGAGDCHVGLNFNECCVGRAG